MHWRAEAQATPLKVVMGVKSRAFALADVMKRAEPVAKPTRTSASIKEPVRMARVQVFITW
jgi:hypothetical protein